MKFLSTLISVVSILGVTTAFAPHSSFGVQRSAPVSSTAAYDGIMTNLELMDHLASVPNALKVILLQCDSHDCQQVHGFQTSDGWHFKEGLRTGNDVNNRILMMEMDDTE